MYRGSIYGQNYHDPREDESIYDLIPKKVEQPSKPPRHTSKFKSMVKDETKSNKNESKTMGPAKVELNDPQNFKKKNTDTLPEVNDFRYPDADKNKPAVPKHTERPLMGIKSNKNFITTNAVENIMSVPKKPAAKFADTKHGATHPLEPSGLQPKYREKNDYGETPKYLVKRNEEQARKQQEYDEYVKMSMRQGAMKELSTSERNNVLAGLKCNWNEIHHQYQGLSVVTDTAPKKNRKERMEAEMNQLEKDIELLEKHQKIFIAQPKMMGAY